MPGRLVNWHYTGLFILVASRYLESGIASLGDSALEARLRSTRDEMIDSARSALVVGAADTRLWTSETWSNALVLWALAETEGIDRGSPPARALEDQFTRELRRSGLMTEDRAFALLAGFHLAVCLETTRDARVRRVIERLRCEDKDEDVRTAVEPLLDLLESRAAQQLQHSLATTLIPSNADYVARPPLLTREVHRGCYTINLPERPVNILLILVGTAAVTSLTLLADVASGRLRLLLTLVPLTLGVLATIAQVANLNLGNLLGRREASRETQE